MDVTPVQVAIGLLALLVPGGLFAALRFQRETANGVAETSGEIVDAAVDVIGALRTELEHTRDDLKEEREARRELAGEVRSLTVALGDTNAELERTRDEVVKLRRILVARGIDVE